MTIAYLFPGQGSQSKGMLGEFADDVVRDTFAEASEVLGYDLWSLTQDDDGERLSQTEITQPALLVAGVALYRAARAAGLPAADVMAGHSLGEYTALVCADSIAFADGVALVRDRGRFMQDAVAPGAGAMAAILGLDDDAVIAACAAVDLGVVEAVNFNAPGQVVIAGENSAVAAAIEQCQARGARRAMPLPVSVPSHCALMQPAAERLAQTLAEIEIQTPTVPVINNVDVAAVDTPAAIRDALVRQLYNPVRWVEIMQRIAGDGATAAVECGPGKVLAGLQRRIDKTVAVHAVDTPAAMAAARTSLAEVTT